MAAQRGLTVSHLITGLGIAYAGCLALDRLLKRAVGQGTLRKPTRVLITGGSRGLGFALAKHYARRGADLILLAPDEGDLSRARDMLLPIAASARADAEVVTYLCDITRVEQVSGVIAEIDRRFGSVDILINNAGIMEVAPLDSVDVLEFERVISTNLTGMIRVTLESLPLLKRGARIVNIASIGGAMAVPHMLAYTVSKFGAVGFSLGLDGELGGRGISVTTILPGLMRTGSHVHASFGGKAQQEYSWFSLSATLPGLSMPAEAAADEIAWAAQKRVRLAPIGLPAKVARMLYQLFPETALAAMREVNALLPSAPRVRTTEFIEGRNLESMAIPGDEGRKLNQEAS